MKKIISFIAIFVSLVAVSSLLVMGGYLAFEPEMTIAQVTSTSSITVTLTVDEEITLSPPPSDIAMSPAISVSVDQSNGSGDWNVKTNATAGYDLKFNASTTPALKSDNDEFDDAVNDNAVTWGTAGGNACEGLELCFGFKVSGTDATGYTNWSGFSTTTKTVATRGSATPALGIDTTMDVRAEQFGVFAPSGSYSAIIIGTATTK